MIIEKTNIEHPMVVIPAPIIKAPSPLRRERVRVRGHKNNHGRMMGPFTAAFFSAMVCTKCGWP
jgi:hypothetical protein